MDIRILSAAEYLKICKRKKQTKDLESFTEFQVTGHVKIHPGIKKLPNIKTIFRDSVECYKGILEEFNFRVYGHGEFFGCRDLETFGTEASFDSLTMDSGAHIIANPLICTVINKAIIRSYYISEIHKDSSFGELESINCAIMRFNASVKGPTLFKDPTKIESLGKNAQFGAQVTFKNCKNTDELVLKYLSKINSESESYKTFENDPVYSKSIKILQDVKNKQELITQSLSDIKTSPAVK
jgi:hypothetical protein